MSERRSISPANGSSNPPGATRRFWFPSRRCSAAKVISMSKGMFGPLTANQDNRAYDLFGIWQPVRFVVRGPGKIEDVWFQPSLTGAKVQVTASSGGKVRAKIQGLAEWTGRL